MEPLGPLQPSYKCLCWSWIPSLFPKYSSITGIRLCNSGVHESPSGSGLQPVLAKCWLLKQGRACRLQETACALKSSHWPQLPSGWSDPKSQRWGFFPIPVVEPKLYQREARFWGGQAGSATKPFMRQAPACSAGPQCPFTTSVFQGNPT